MEIVLSKDVLISFITQKADSDEHKKIINQIIDNDESIFLFSKKYFSFLKNELSEENDLEYQALFIRFSDKGLNIKSSETSTSFDDEFINLYNNSTKNSIIAISYLTPRTSVLSAIPKIAIIKSITKPNYHWIVTQIAILHPHKVSVMFSDFTTNNDIDIFMKNCYFILKYISTVNIFDTQCNLAHTKFNYLIENRIRVKYYTKTNRENNKFDRRDDIQKKFGRSAKTYILLPQKKAHGRRIIFDNLILTSDEDFWNLEVNGSDWGIDIQYSKDISDKWLTRVVDYREV